MFDVIIDHLLRHIPGAPGTVPYCPEMPAPVALAQMGELVLEEAGCSSLEPLHDVGERELGRVLEMHVDMIGADGPLEDPDVLAVADLDEQCSASLLHLSREDVEAVLGDPDDVDGQTREGMAAVPVGIGHSGPC